MRGMNGQTFSQYTRKRGKSHHHHHNTSFLFVCLRKKNSINHESVNQPDFSFWPYDICRISTHQINYYFCFFKVCLVDVQGRQGEATAAEFQQEFGQDKVFFIKCDVASASDLQSMKIKSWPQCSLLSTFGQP